MALFDVGDFWSQTFYIRNAAGALVAPGAFTCTLTMADGTTPGVTIVNSATGTYDCSFGPLTALHIGRNVVFAAATGANACSQPDQFDVRSSVSIALLSMADARKTLNFPDAYTQDDEELRDVVEVASARIERRYGAVIPRTVTETVSSANGRWALSTTPVISITSITGKITGLTSYATTDLNIRPYSGVLYSTGGYALQPGPYQIVYQAGITGVIPPEYLQATRILLGHMWSTQRGAGTRPGEGSEDTYNTDYAIWNQIDSLLGDRTMPGFS